MSSRLAISLTAALCLVCRLAWAQCLDYEFAWGHPRPQGNPVHAIAIVDDNLVYAVGEFGCVLRSEDAGATWELRQDLTGIGSHFYDALALDSDSLLAVGQAPGVYRSEDGGSTWSVVATPHSATLRDIALIPGGGISAAGDDGTLLISHDGGASWSSTGPGVGDIRDHTWLSAEVCIVAGDGVFHRTTNAGATWSFLNASPAFGFNEVFFLDDLHGRANSDFERWQSSDGGVTWTEIIGFNHPLYRVDTLIIDAQHWLAITNLEGAELWETLDAGVTWEPLQFRGAGGFLDIDRLASGRVLLTSDLGDLLYSDDLGDTLTNATNNLDNDSPAPFNTIAARADGVLFAANMPSVWNQPETWLRSDDGGSTWTHPDSSPGLRWVLALDFYDDQVGVAGAYEDIRYTSDGGNTWNAASLPAGKRVSDVVAVTDTIMLASTYSTQGFGGIFASHDGGATWSPSTDGLGANLQCGPLFFFNESDGLFFARVGDTPQLHVTQNAGGVWGFIPTTGLPRMPYDTCWPDGWQTAVATVYQGDAPGIYFSDDFASTWTLVHPGLFTQLEFRDALHGVAIPAYGGEVAVTCDGGATWDTLPVPTQGWIQGVGVSGDHFLIGAAGSRRLVMKDAATPGDLDGDGDVDQADLGLLLSCYGEGDCGDIDGDGDTDQADLGALLANYGAGA